MDNDCSARNFDQLHTFAQVTVINTLQNGCVCPNLPFEDVSGSEFLFIPTMASATDRQSNGTLVAV